MLGSRLTPILVLCAVLAPSGAARAQSVGVIGGTTLGEINVSGNEPANVVLTDKFEAVGGLYFAFDLGELVSFQPEALISDKGSRLDYAGVDQRIRLRYAEFPLTLRLSAPRDSALHWMRLIAGSYVAYLLDASSRPTGGGRTADLDEAFERLDWGWVAGLGVNLGRVDVDLRYNGGVVDISKGGLIEGLLPPAGDQKLRNRWASLLGRFRF